MRVREFAQSLDLKILTCEGKADSLDKEVTGVYVCDLLSWVMSHAKPGDAWITVLTHINTAAVALLAEVSCVIIPESVEVEAATLKKAGQEGIVIMATCMNSYEICCRAYASGIGKP
jgi:hypothetical protein